MYNYVFVRIFILPLISIYYLVQPMCNLYIYIHTNVDLPRPKRF